MKTNNTYKGALINNNTIKNMLRYKTETRPGLVALYDIRPGNGAGPFLQPRSPHGAIRGSLRDYHLLLKYDNKLKQPANKCQRKNVRRKAD